MSSNHTQVVLVTGANRGVSPCFDSSPLTKYQLGQTLASLTAARSEAITLYASSRDGVDLNLVGKHPNTTVKYIRLDITDQISVDIVRKLITESEGRLDVLINNAGVSYEEFDNSTFSPDLVRKTLESNYYGVERMLKMFIPLMPPGGRIVNLTTSGTWQMVMPNAELKKRLWDDDPDATALHALAEEYVEASRSVSSEDGWLKSGFWPAYCTAKAFVNLLTASEARRNPKLLINAACPGIVATGMAIAGQRVKTPTEGARLPMRLAFDDIDGVSGKLWAGTSSLDTGPGEVVEDWPGKQMVID